MWFILGLIPAKVSKRGANALQMQPELRFARPHIIHPRARAALNALADAGLLSVDVDPRGPMTWKPTAEMQKAMPGFRAPKKGESFPLTTE